MKKIVFMGTPEIAVPSLKALVENGFNIPLVITQPDKPKGRGQNMAFSPVKECALSYGLNVYQPEKIRNNQEAMDIIKASKNIVVKHMVLFLMNVLILYFLVQN